ncbi:hypothetical protein TNCV_3657311 [Trichonephila clavipes]|nr:hypothetical protein TNCV_3657311 [Trichonephila clavipes]
MTRRESFCLVHLISSLKRTRHRSCGAKTDVFSSPISCWMQSNGRIMLNAGRKDQSLAKQRSGTNVDVLLLTSVNCMMAVPLISNWFLYRDTIFRPLVNFESPRLEIGQLQACQWLSISRNDLGD